MKRRLAASVSAIVAIVGAAGVALSVASASETPLPARGAVLEAQQACGQGLVFDGHAEALPSLDGPKNPSAEAAIDNFLSDIYPGIKDLPRAEQSGRAESRRFELRRAGRPQLIIDVSRNGEDDWVVSGYTGCNTLLVEGRRGVAQ